LMSHAILVRTNFGLSPIHCTKCTLPELISPSIITRILPVDGSLLPETEAMSSIAAKRMAFLLTRKGEREVDKNESSGRCGLARGTGNTQQINAALSKM